MTRSSHGDLGRRDGGDHDAHAATDGIPPLPKQVLVIGSGLIGTSLGLAMRDLGVDVALADTDPDALRKSVARGAGRAAFDDDTPDLVVVAVPPRAVADVALAALDRYPGAVVIDVASSKSAIVQAVAARSIDSSRFVGTHPMAGREVSGPAGAVADLFDDRPWVITATSQTDARALAVAEAVARACGAVVVPLSAEVHDRAAALTSHVPQLVASALAAQLAAAPAGDVVISGQGLRDTTRIAESDPHLWADILASNAAHVVPIIDGVVADLAAAAANLRTQSRQEQDDAGQSVSDAVAGVGTGTGTGMAEVVELLQRGNLGRNRLPAKHGGEAKLYRVIGVVLADRPGQLGQLFAAAGDAGVNLEDVRIEHSVGRLKALVELSVLPENEATLAAALRAGGWRLRAP